MPPEEQNAPTSPAGTSSPAPAQTSPAPSGPESPATEGAQPSDLFSGFDFANMDFADETGETVVVDKTKPEPGQQPAGVQTKPAEPTPAATAAPVVTPPTPPVTTAPAATQTPAPAPAQPAPSATPDQDPYLKAWQENAKALDAHLTQYYAIDEATAEKFLESPREVLPGLLAKVHASVMQNTYKAVLDRLPPLVQATAEAVKSHGAAEDRFFKSWPQFDRNNSEQMKVLTTYGTMFRNMHPQAPESDFTKFVGAAAAAQLGLKMPIAKGNGKGKPVAYSPAGASAPSSGAGEPKPTQFEDFFSAVLEPD